MANLGTLWFDVDLNLQKLQQSIQNGNAQVLKDLKVSLAPNATELKEAIDSILKSQSFKVNLEASQEGLNKIKEQLGNLSGEVKLTSSGTTLSQESIKSIVELLSQQAQKTQEVTTATQSAAEASKSAAKAANEEAESSKKANVERERQMKLLYEVQTMYSKIANLSPENSGMSPSKINAVADSFQNLANKLKDVPPKTSLQELSAEFSALKAQTKGFFQEVGQSSKAVESIRLVRYALKEVNDQIASGTTSSKLEGFREQLQTINREMHNLMKSGDFSGIQNLFAGHKGFSDGVVNIIRQMVTEMKKLGVATQETAGITSHLTAAEQQLAASIRHSTDSMRGQSQILSDLKSMAMQYLSVWGAQSFVNSIIQTGGLLEQQRMSIGAILGDLSQANHLFGQITQLALKSPFGVVQLDTMSKQLTAYNFKYSELYDWTKRLADISAATGTEVSRLALALGHVRSEGALSGYTLRQFAMGNVPLLQTLATQLGKTTSEIRKMTREKAITYEDVEQALRTLTEEGGIFFNAQEVMSNALNAKFKNMHDAFDIMFGKMAESNLVGGSLKKLAETMTVLAKNWEQTGAVILSVVGYLGYHKVATMASTKAIAQSNLQAGRFTASQLEMQVATGNLNKKMLLQAVAAKKLSVADAEAAAATLGLSRAQLQHVANTGKVTAAYNMASLATSKYTVQQLRLLATFRAGSWTSFSTWLNGLKVAWLGVGSAARVAGTAIKGFFAAAWPMLAISAAVEGITYLIQKSSEAKDRIKDMFQTANEGFKSLEKSAVQFQIGASVNMDDKMLEESVKEMDEILKSYLPKNAHGVLNEAFKIDPDTGKSVHSLKEQYEMLAEEIKTTKDAYKELSKVGDALERSNAETDGIFDESFRQNTEDYINALKKRNQAETDFIANNRVLVAEALAKTRKEFENYDKYITSQNQLYEKTNGQSGFAADDLKSQLELMKAGYKETEYFILQVQNANTKAGDSWMKYESAVRNAGIAHKEMSDDMTVFSENLGKRLKAIYGQNVNEWTDAQKLAVQKSVELFMTGIDGYSDMAESERIEIEKKLLAPYNIPINVDAREANKALTEMQAYLNGMVGNDWVVKLKLETVGSFEELYDQLDKTVKKSGETMKKLGDGISKERKQLLKSDIISKDEISKLVGVEKEYFEAVQKRKKAVEAANKEGFKLSSLDKENKKNEQPNKKAESAAEKAAKARTKQAEAQMKIDEELAKQRFELEDAIADARVASIESNAERERVQREEEFKKQERQLDRQVEEWKRKSFELAKKEHEANPKNKTISFFDTPVGQAGWQGQSLTAEQAAIDKAQRQALADNEKRRIKEENETLIASHADYIDKKIALDKKYKESITKINRAIFDAEKRGDKETVEQLKRTRAEAEKNRAKEQADLTFKQLQEDPEYIRAFEDLDNVSTETLEHLIEMFEKAKKGAARSLDPKDLKQYTDTIEQMWDSIRKNDPSHALIVARENWKKANDKVKKAESDLYNVRRGGFRMMTVYNKETKEYEQQLMTIADAEKALSIAKEERKKATKKLSLADEEARKIIDELADSVGNLGSMIGGTAGEILGAVSSVAKYTTTILTAHDQIAKLGTSALDTFQKASVVLSLITTGMQIAQSIASLFSSNLEEIIAKNKMLAQMAIAVSNYRLEVEKAMREEDQWFSSTKLQGLVNQWQSSTDAAAEYFNYIKHAQEDYDRTVKQYSYVGVGEFLEKIVHSGDYFNALVNTGDGYASLQALVKTTFNEDLFGADGLINVDVAKKAIEVWGDQIQGEGRAIIEHLIELAEEGTSKWMESLREYVSELYSPIADDLTDALFEWYETGVDVMDAFNDKARDTFQDVAKEMMKQLVNTMVFDELKNKLIAAYTVYTKTVSAGPEAGSANSNNTQDALNALRASLNAALIEFENTTKEALPELQAFMELLGQMSDDIFGQASDDLPDYFDNIKSAWQSTLLDMKGDAEQLGKEIARIMFESLVKKNVLNDEFNEWLKGWVERYEAATNAESEAERNALLAKLYDERAEKVKELTDRTKEYAEMAGYAADADEQLTNSLENLKDTLLDSLLDAESDAGDLGKKIAQSLIKDMLTEMLAAEKYANQIEAIHELWQNILVGGGSWTNENGETFDMQSVLGMIAKLNNDIAEDESIAALADQYKQLTEEINGANTSFGDFHDSFMDAMLDMENGAENFKKKLHETLVKDIIDKKVFGEAFTINGNPYENFEEYQKDWTKRYLDALEAGDTDLMRELVKEMEERETAMAEAAEQYAKELQEAAKDTTFTAMSDSFLSALMDTNKTAEDWAQDIGKTIAKKIFEGMVAEKTLLQGIQDVWDAAVAGATDESGKVDWDKVLANAELQQVAGSTKEEFENLQKAWEALCKSLGVTLDAKELPLGDIDSTILESLTDAEESAEDFGKKIALKLMNEMLSKLVNTRYLDEMKAIREMWQHALNGDVDEEGNAYTIERVTQAIEALRAEISGSTEISNLATQIQDLSKASAQADESFKSMGDSWTSVLTDMDATAEDFGRQIGQNLVSKLVKKLIVDKELQFYLNNIQDAYNQAIESGMSLEDAVAAVEPKIDEAVEATEKWKPVIDEINQKFQKLNEETPFDDLRSRFRSELMDMSGDVNSFASDLNKSITEAFIDAFVLADFDDRLEEWKKRYSAIMKSDTMTEAERAKALKDLQNEIVEAKEGYVEGARSIQDLLGYGEYKDQDATVNMADKATYDQFEQYLGIAVSQQITAEHQLGVQLQILSTLQGMAGLSDPVNDSLLTQVALSNSHLSNIYNVNYKMYQSLETRLQTIEMNTAYLKKL